ncbi:MAG: hypothetical protein F4110_13065 [Acidimicrobiaceae bacterium]|nr:hypothetical protein [Acidimicrobiaceae bacterium]MXZ98579.1 hypothetical protein [Acidimicrobiaceae bacterium]MYE96826.1 hypothetical protein [Acidimicrobiaceae bacterium]MYH42779.1 hypothetical protein [Acidimicrobiaceae bacterium]MYI54889.1 hypothetical protein [Acidimicrobiaceae bacterium]
MATDYGTGFEVRLGDMRGCVLIENAATVVVETVAEAREAILSYATDALGHHAHDPERREHLRLNVRPGGPTWEDLAECEKGRRYDPADPETGMTCSYLLYLQGGLEGVGGVMWTYGVTIRATAPPRVWNHPADQPAGLERPDDRDNDLEA